MHYATGLLRLTQPRNILVESLAANYDTDLCRIQTERIKSDFHKPSVAGS